MPCPKSEGETVRFKGEVLVILFNTYEGLVRSKYPSTIVQDENRGYV